MTAAVVPNYISEFCRRCGRSLRASSSVTRGYGPTCVSYLHEAREAADLTDFHPWQADKASELIETCGLVPTSHPEVFRSVSSDGSRAYLSTAEGCTCKAGQYRVPCYHRAGVAMMRATRRLRRARRPVR
ncbi:hypothetical protein F4561_003457 [Lipingzhangella halophila]|uniref:SWIM-type domain-containing protein n=1 Tax=Lipingzhangella halophila TaxID=1783352 RepID=A0A7W7W338_9ACTN|nr:DUF6011 domain-containing protein [Lipingzhangella halophila]MBB4932637.1 hypothetical protein [Lipingzhangella halophila]